MNSRVTVKGVVLVAFVLLHAPLTWAVERAEVEETARLLAKLLESGLAVI